MANGSSSIDARLARLVERHEALTDTVEMITTQQLKNTEAIRDLTAVIMSLSEIVHQHESRLRKLE